MNTYDLDELAHAYVHGEATSEQMQAIEILLRNADGGQAREFALLCQLELELIRHVALEHPVTSGEQPVARRGWLRGLVAASVGAGVGAFASHQAGAQEVRALRASVARLTEFQAAVRKYLDAFRLALDGPNELGPAAVLSGFATIHVAGVYDPDLIARVEVSWGDVNAPFAPVSLLGSRDEHGIGAFLERRELSVENGKLYRVIVRAIPHSDHRAELEELKRGERWLQRESLFVGTPSGLVAAAGPLEINVAPGFTFTTDEWALSGVAAESGSVMLSARTADNRWLTIARPFDVEARKPWPMVTFDLSELLNGDATLHAAWLPWRAEQWGAWGKENSPAILEAVGDDAWPQRGVLQKIPVRIALEPPQIRSARWVLQQGGVVGPHGGDELRDVKDLRDPLLSVQRVMIPTSPVSDLRPLRHLRDLQGLQLSNCPLGDAALVGIAERHPKLQWLHLSGTQVSDSGVARDLLRLSQLTSLNLSDHPRVTNRSVAGIAGQLQELTSLDLSGTGVQSIEPLATLKKLKQLNVARTAVSEEECAALQGRLTGLHIDR